MQASFPQHTANAVTGLGSGKKKQFFHTLGAADCEKPTSEKRKTASALRVVRLTTSHLQPSVSHFSPGRPTAKDPGLITLELISRILACDPKDMTWLAEEIGANMVFPPML
jgi:hypothetical protein